MAWVEIDRMNDVYKSTKHFAVTVSRKAQKGGNCKSSLVITVRPQLMKHSCPFFVIGAPVKVLIGDGTHIGLVRIESDGPHTVSRIGRKLADGSSNLSLIVPIPGVIYTKRGRTGVKVIAGDDWLEITLPAWDRVPPQIMRGTIQGEPIKVASAPFRTAATNGTGPRPMVGGR